MNSLQILNKIERKVERLEPISKKGNSAFQVRNFVIKGCGENDTPFTQGYPQGEATIKTDFFESIKKGVLVTLGRYGKSRNGNITVRHNGNSDTPNATPAFKNIQSNQYSYDKRNSKCNGYLSKCNTDAELRKVKVLSQSHDKMCRAINQLILCGMGVLGYIKDLSKTISVTPQRHCGFFVPESWLDSQSIQQSYTTQFIYALTQGITPIARTFKSMACYGWVTSKNKPYGEYSGRYLIVPRVNPSTLFNSVALSQKLLGGLSHA